MELKFIHNIINIIQGIIRTECTTNNIVHRFHISNIAIHIM